MCITAYLPLDKEHYFTVFCPCADCEKGEINFLPSQMRNNRLILCPEDSDGNSRIAADSEGRSLGLWDCPDKTEQGGEPFLKEKLSEFFSRLDSDELQGFFPLPGKKCSLLSVEKKPFLQLTEIRIGPGGLKVKVKNEKKPLIRFCEYFNGLPVFKSEKKNFHHFFTDRKFTEDDIFDFFSRSRAALIEENPAFTINRMILVESNKQLTSMTSSDFRNKEISRKFPISHD